MATRRRVQIIGSQAPSAPHGPRARGRAPERERCDRCGGAGPLPGRAAPPRRCRQGPSRPPPLAAPSGRHRRRRAPVQTRGWLFVARCAPACAPDAHSARTGPAAAGLRPGRRPARPARHRRHCGVRVPVQGEPAAQGAARAANVGGAPARRRAPAAAAVHHRVPGLRLPAQGLRRGGGRFGEARCRGRAPVRVRGPPGGRRAGGGRPRRAADARGPGSRTRGAGPPQSRISACMA